MQNPMWYISMKDDLIYLSELHVQYYPVHSI